MVLKKESTPLAELLPPGLGKAGEKLDTKKLLRNLSSLVEKTNPRLDKVKASILRDLEEQGLAANILESGVRGLKKDLGEIGIHGEAQKEYITLFRSKWVERNMPAQTTAILASRELKAVDNFILYMETTTRLKELIEAAKPGSNFTSLLKDFASKHGIDPNDPAFAPYFEDAEELIASGFGLGLSAKDKAEKDEPEKRKKNDKPAKRRRARQKDERRAEKAESRSKRKAEKKPDKVAKTPEKREVLKKPGRTLVMGDSISVGMVRKGKNADIWDTEGPVTTVAKGSQTISWGIKQAKRLGRQNRLKDFQNVVVLFGTNDIGWYKTAEDHFRQMEKLYQILQGDLDLDGTKEVQGVQRIYAATIPPIKGYTPYKRGYKKRNETRKSLNEKIRHSKYVYHVVDLDRPESQGGLAADDDPDKLSEAAYKGGLRDWLHPSQELIAQIYQRELTAGTNKTA